MICLFVLRFYFVAGFSWFLVLGLRVGLPCCGWWVFGGGVGFEGWWFWWVLVGFSFLWMLCLGLRDFGGFWVFECMRGSGDFGGVPVFLAAVWGWYNIDSCRFVCGLFASA